jgi:hypothetical protein
MLIQKKKKVNLPILFPDNFERSTKNQIICKSVSQLQVPHSMI